MESYNMIFKLNLGIYFILICCTQMICFPAGQSINLLENKCQCSLISHQVIIATITDLRLCIFFNQWTSTFQETFGCCFFWSPFIKLQLGLPPAFNSFGCISTLFPIVLRKFGAKRGYLCFDAALLSGQFALLTRPESLHSQHSDDVQLFSRNLNDKKPTNWVTLHLLNKYTLAW